jgi:hypothetical protein
MTTRETKLIALSAAAGILTRRVGARAAWGKRKTFLRGRAGCCCGTSACIRRAASRESSLRAGDAARRHSRTEPGGDYRGRRAGCRSSHRFTQDRHRRFGRVEQPEAQLAAVSARIGGRVDKLYVQYTGERVRSGQPVADLYSPEVATAIEEYRLAEENRNGLHQSDDNFARTQADALVKASQHKLELWGISANRSMRRKRKACPHVTIYGVCLGNGGRSQGDARAICQRRRHAVHRGRSQPGLDQGRCLRGAIASDSPGTRG